MKNQMEWRSELLMMNIIKMTLENLTEMRYITLNVPKLNIKSFSVPTF